jgi:hypothetical protein
VEEHENKIGSSLDILQKIKRLCKVEIIHIAGDVTNTNSFIHSFNLI